MSPKNLKVSMKFLCVLLLAVPAFCHPSIRQTDNGMMDPAEATLMCTTGTEIGAKLEQAFSNCMSGPATRSLMRNSCPSVDEVRAWVESAIGQVDDYDYDYAAQAIEEAITFIETELGDQIPDDIAEAIMNCMSEFA